MAGNLVDVYKAIMRSVLNHLCPSSVAASGLKDLREMGRGEDFDVISQSKHIPK